MRFALPDGHEPLQVDTGWYSLGKCPIKAFVSGSKWFCPAHLSSAASLQISKHQGQ